MSNQCQQRATCQYPCRPATNGIGWNIMERFVDLRQSKGWTAIRTPYECPLVAKKELTLIPTTDEVEHMVYEALA